MPVKSIDNYSETAVSTEKAIGERLRSFRVQRGYTLEALAARAKLSKSYLSRLEDGDRQASIAALLSISRALGISVGTLLSEETKGHRTSPVIGSKTCTFEGNGLTYQPHSGELAGSVMQPLRVTISASRIGNELYRHDGEEWLYVLSGYLIVTLGEDEFALGPGDSLHFDATIGHRLTVNGPQDVEAILVASVPSRNLLSSYL